MVDRLGAEHAVQVEWLAYYLRPDTPPEGMELPAHVRARYAPTHEHLRDMAEAAGLPIVFPVHMPNTRRAHEATEYARARGKHLEFHRAVFHRYYAEEQDISHWAVLREAAQEVGLDADEMQQQVDAGMFTQAVEEQIALAQEIGITGVPTYILNNKYAIIGAQPYEVFQRALVRIADEEQAQAEKQ